MKSFLIILVTALALLFTLSTADDRLIVTPYSGSGAVTCPDLKTANTTLFPTPTLVANLSALSSSSNISSCTIQPLWSPISFNHKSVASNASENLALIASSVLHPRMVGPVIINTIMPAQSLTSGSHSSPDLVTTVVVPAPTHTSVLHHISGLATTMIVPVPIRTSVSHSISGFATTTSSATSTPTPLGSAPDNPPSGENTTVSSTGAGIVSSVSTNASAFPLSTVFEVTPTYSSQSLLTTNTTNFTNATSIPLPTSSLRYRGFNIVNQSPANPGLWKGPEEWSNAFVNIRDLPGDFNAIRLYSTTDGSTQHLLNALPAARALNLSVFAGVWSGGDDASARFGMEIQGLDKALAQLGCDNIIAVSVGNEDMYNAHRTDKYQRPLKDVMLLVNQIKNVTDVLDRYGCSNVKLTHTDTFNEWLNTTASEPLIRQVDFLTVNIFPYWENVSIADASFRFWSHVAETAAMTAQYGKEIWIGETGWPVSGPVMGSAVPSPGFARQYWSQVGCGLMQTMSAFWYVEWDTFAVPSFGLMQSNGTSFVGDLVCG